MNDVANFFKQNPIIIACVVVMLLAVGYIVYQTQVREPEFLAQAEEYSKLESNLIRLKNTDVVIPSPERGGEPQTLKALINRAAINQLDESLKKITEHEATVNQLVVKRNRVGHTRMIPGVLPELTNVASTAVKTNLSRYIFDRYRSINASNTMGAAQSKVGLPPTKTEIDAAKKAFSDSYIEQWSIDAVTQLSAERQELLNARLKTIHLQMLQNRAKQFPVYIEPMVYDRQTQRITKNGAYNDVPVWLGASEILSAQDLLPLLWIEQRKMWVLGDIIEIILKSNNGSSSVPDSVVKRIVSIDIADTDLLATRGSGTVLPKDVTLSFSNSAFGRSSNAYYMVRNANITVIIDVARKEEFFAAIQQTNLTSPKILSIENVDDAADLRAGYYYGDCDAVKITVQLETLWFNELMLDFMPQSEAIKQGIVPAATTKKP